MHYIRNDVKCLCMIKKHFKLAAYLGISLILLFFITPKVSADEFKTIYNVIYEISDNGETTVTQNINLENLKNDVVATRYSLTVKQLNIYDIEARDESGSMEIEEFKVDGGIRVTANFNENIIGKGRSTDFSVRYKTKDIASKVGGILNLRIPRVAGLDEIREYNVEIRIPTTMGPKIFVSPHPNKEYSQGGINYLVFDKEGLTESGISASYGRYQLLNYKLKYQLKNDQKIANIQEIALPPDIREHQQVNHKYITPEPLDVYEDQDGNLIARYKVNPGELVEIELVGSVRIFGKQINPEFGGEFEDIPQELIEKYTTPQKFWESNSPEILTLKNKLYDEEQNVSFNAKNIYDYITQNFFYDFTVIEKDFVERNGALATINNEVAPACMEFTDLFIATARAMGIPAREHNGYSINTVSNVNLPLSIKFKSGDLLHAWPEFYDPVFGWVAIDPTWGNTSGLDFFTKIGNNHFTFVIKGLNSEMPLPAGLYRTDDSSKLVEVGVSQDDTADSFTPLMTFYKVPTLNLIELFKGNRKYLVKNTGGNYIYDLKGMKLLPYEVKTIYLNKDENQIQFKDINYEDLTTNIIYTDQNPKNSPINFFTVLISLTAGLLLCSFVYYLLIVKEGLKKLPFPRHFRLRGQDQQRNQN